MINCKALDFKSELIKYMTDIDKLKLLKDDACNRRVQIKKRIKSGVIKSEDELHKANRLLSRCGKVIKSIDDRLAEIKIMHKYDNVKASQNKDKLLIAELKKRVSESLFIEAVRAAKTLEE